MMRAYFAEQRRTARVQADMAEAFATGYGGCKTDEGAAALQRFIESRRK